MTPLLEDGDIIVVNKNIFNLRQTKVGDIILFENPINDDLYIKKCYGVYKDSIFVIGMNLSNSTDSRHFGRIEKKKVKGWLWKKI